MNTKLEKDKALRAYYESKYTGSSLPEEYASNPTLKNLMAKEQAIKDYNDVMSNPVFQTSPTGTYGPAPTTGEFVTKTLPQNLYAGALELGANLYKLINLGSKLKKRGYIEKKAYDVALDLLLPKEVAPIAKAVSPIQEPKPTELEKWMSERAETGFKTATDVKLGANKYLAPAQTIGAGIAEAAPSLIATAPIDILVPGVPGVALSSVLQGQAMYNPEDTKSEDNLYNRSTQAFTDTLFGVGFHTGFSLLGKVLRKAPIEVAEKNIMNKVTDSILDNADERIARLPREDFLAYVRAEKPIDDNARQFFSTTEWRDLIRKYGTKVADYPEFVEIKLPTKATGEAGIIGERAMITSPEVDYINELGKAANDTAVNIANRTEDGVKKASFNLLNTIDTLNRDYSYKINKKEIYDLVMKTANNITDIDNYNLAIASREAKEAVWKRLGYASIGTEKMSLPSATKTSLIKDLDKLKKLYGSIQNKGDIETIVNSYNKWALKSGTQDLDSLVRTMNELGFDIGNMPNATPLDRARDIIMFANDVPTKGIKRVTLTPPESINVNQELDNVLRNKPIFTVERPRFVPQGVSNIALKEDKIIQETATPQFQESKIPEVKKLEPATKPTTVPEYKPGSPLTEYLRDVGRGAKELWNEATGFLLDRVAKYGPAGQELATRVRRISAKRIAVAEAIAKDFDTMGLKLLDDSQWENLRLVMENKATPQTKQVADIAPQLKQFFDKYYQAAGLSESGVAKVEFYFPRFLNEAGKRKYAPGFIEEEVKRLVKDNPDLPLLEARAKAEQNWKYMTKNYVGKQGFERERLLKDLSTEYRMKPQEELAAVADAYSRRIPVIEELGPKTELADKLIVQMQDSIPQGMPNREAAIKRARELGETLVDRVIGKYERYDDLNSALKLLSGAHLTGNISPMTALANINQWTNAYLRFGINGLLDANNRSYQKIVKELGMMNEDIGKLMKTSDNASNFVSKAMKLYGMDATERFGYKRTAAATYGAIEKAFETLKLDPSDKAARDLLHSLAMYIEPGSLDAAIKAGKMAPDEMMVGVLTGVQDTMFNRAPGMRPVWADSQIGSVAYSLKSYLFSQLRLMSKAPLHRQAIFFFLMNPILGIPNASVRLLSYKLTNQEDKAQKVFSNPIETFKFLSMANAATYADVLGMFESPSRTVGTLSGGFEPVISTVSAAAQGRNPLMALMRSYALPRNVLNATVSTETQQQLNQPLNKILFPEQKTTGTKFKSNLAPSLGSKMGGF